MADQDSTGVNPPVGPPVEEVAVTGRPADVAPENSTFRSRAGKLSSKAVEDDAAENKSVASKSAARKSK